MRSSVSVILSSPTPDPNMSHPDYEQNAHDHAAVLILVKHLGEDLTQKAFSRLYERICRVNHVKVVDSNGVPRAVWARYVKDYLVGNNDWGDFQTHRRLLGLVTIGKCRTQVELNEICRLHESLKVKYTNTLFDSRCIVIGVNDGPDTPNFTPPSNFKSKALFYATDGEHTSLLESQIAEFLSYLFWVLESKRHERCREKIERVSLLLAPFERRDFVGLDMESRSNRKRCLGRMTKHLGDLCLQTGLPADALTNYHTAVDILRAINDWLWIGGASEGLCAASAILHYPNMCRSSPVQRNSSLPEGSQGHARSSSVASIDTDSFAVETKQNIQNILSPDEILKSYREAIVHYSKYQNAGVIETEACYKAARIAIEQNSILQAASFLQNVVFINLALNEEEKIQRLMSLSELYTKIGFHRKASFYRRLAATRYVSARNPQTNWEQCYNLMLQALPGHKLTLDPADYPPDRQEGWPGLQKQVLQDLVVAATRVGHSAVATRHMTFLLQVMWSQLTPSERHDCALQLQTLAAQCEGAPVPLVLDSGLVIPPANLVTVPQTESFTVQNLKPYLRPSKLEKTKEDFGPFLFTPLHFGSMERKKASNKLEYLWVADEKCEVVIELSNPFPFELEVSNMRLLTGGIVFESLPLTLSLPPEAVNYSITLSGTPRETGELDITGYSTHTLGVKSNCRLKNIPKMIKSVYSVDVIPALPRLQVSSSLPNKIENGASVSLYAGESVECILTLSNVGNQPVEWLEVSIESLMEPSLQQQIFSWDKQQIQEALPLQSGNDITFPLKMLGAASFLTAFNHDTESIKSSMLSAPSSFMSASTRAGANLYDRFAPRSASSASFNRSGPSSLNSFCSQFNKLSLENSPKALECQLKVRYSGGPGLAAGYCRISVFVLRIEILNSVLITNWDVIPAETSNEFYMVLDITNMTNQELELKYTSTKSILIEENESCRIPIPVERCPLSKIGKYFESGDGIKDMMELNSVCSEHIASLVDLNWCLVGTERTGKASLRGITLSMDMLDIVRMSPVNWEVYANGERVEPQSELTCVVGKSLLLGMRVHNSLSWSLVDLELSTQFFQDHQNGIINYQLDTRIATAGATQIQLPKVLCHDSAYHECVVVFLNPGQYKVNIQCTSKQKHVWKLIPPLDIQVVKN